VPVSTDRSGNGAMFEAMVEAFLSIYYWRLSRTDQQRVGPIIGRRASKLLISTKYQLHNKLNINSNHPLATAPAGQLPVQRVRQRGSVYPKTKPALVYTSIHSTVTAR
jgi:hypothetical protein